MKSNDNQNCYLCKKLVIDSYSKKIMLCSEYRFIGSEIESTYFVCSEFDSIIQLIKRKKLE